MNNMLVNNNNYGYYGMPYGYAQQPVAQPKMTQPLTKEEMEILARQGKQNELQIDEIEFLTALCCHRKDNKSVLQQTADGKVYCPICKQTFNMMDDVTESDVRQLTDTVLDIMQTTKAMYVDMGEQVARQFFQYMPLVKRIPALYRLASEDLARYDGIGQMQPANGASGYALLNGMTGAGFGGYGYPQYGYQQPMMQQPYGYAPQAPQQPMQQPYGYAPQAPVYNQGYAPAPQQNFANDPNPFVATGAPAQQQPAPMTPPPAAAPAPMVTKNETFTA